MTGGQEGLAGRGPLKRQTCGLQNRRRIFLYFFNLNNSCLEGKFTGRKGQRERGLPSLGSLPSVPTVPGQNTKARLKNQRKDKVYASVRLAVALPTRALQALQRCSEREDVSHNTSGMRDKGPRVHVQVVGSLIQAQMEPSGSTCADTIGKSPSIVQKLQCFIYEMFVCN